MPKKSERKIVRQVRDRRLTPAEAAKYRDVRAQVMREFPPAKNPKLRPVKTGIGARIRKAREAQKLTWYAVAKQAGIPNPGTVRDIECGRDATLSSVDAVAHVLGLQLDLVPST
jgi:hypothetical protein